MFYLTHFQCIYSMIILVYCHQSLLNCNYFFFKGQWQDVFPCMISKAAAVELICSGTCGTHDGELRMVCLICGFLLFTSALNFYLKVPSCKSHISWMQRLFFRHLLCLSAKRRYCGSANSIQKGCGQWLTFRLTWSENHHFQGPPPSGGDFLLVALFKMLPMAIPW